jgi:quinol monooxygenase YgiN
VAHVIVVNRFRVSVEDGEDFQGDAERAHQALAERAGYLHGSIGRNVDDPTLWTIVTHWQNVGSYRRALSAYDVKLNAVPLLSRAIEEPSAYEILERGRDLNVQQSRSLD